VESIICPVVSAQSAAPTIFNANKRNEAIPLASSRKGVIVVLQGYPKSGWYHLPERCQLQLQRTHTRISNVPSP